MNSFNSLDSYWGYDLIRHDVLNRIKIRAWSEFCTQINWEISIWDDKILIQPFDRVFVKLVESESVVFFEIKRWENVVFEKIVSFGEFKVLLINLKCDIPFFNEQFRWEISKLWPTKVEETWLTYYKQTNINRQRIQTILNWRKWEEWYWEVDEMRDLLNGKEDLRFWEYRVDPTNPQWVEIWEFIAQNKKDTLSLLKKLDDCTHPNSIGLLLNAIKKSEDVRKFESILNWSWDKKDFIISKIPVATYFKQIVDFKKWEQEFLPDKWYIRSDSYDGGYDDEWFWYRFYGPFNSFDDAFVYSCYLDWVDSANYDWRIYHRFSHIHWSWDKSIEEKERKLRIKELLESY